MPEEQDKNRAPRMLALVAAVFLLVAAVYVLYQVWQVLFPPNHYETAVLATVADTVDAQGVLLFDETLVPGSGSLGYLVEDGERVSAGAAVAEMYTDPAQAGLRNQLTQLTEQIQLLQKAQNTASAQLDSLLKERSSALYDLLDALDQTLYQQTSSAEEQYLLAQNKLWVVTGETTGFGEQIAQLTEQSAAVAAQLGAPAQITAPRTGYFIRGSATARLNAGPADILALDAADLAAYLASEPEVPLDGCAGKLVSGFSWQYCGICPLEQGKKLLTADGKPLKRAVELWFPGQMEQGLSATVQQVQLDEAAGLARFVLTCETVNGDVLRLNRADAKVIVGRTTGLRIRSSAVHYLKEDGTEAAEKGENYIPGVYVKFGNLARFCRIDPVDDAHPLVTEGEYQLVMPSGTDGSVSQVRLYDEIIVSGQNLYDGKLL